MHLTGNESHGEVANLAYGCRSCNGVLASAFKTLKLGRPTNQYNPAKKTIPTFEQYMWAVSNHTREAHDEGGAVIHATPKSKRIEYARRIVSKAQTTKRERADERWNPANEPGDYLVHTKGGGSRGMMGARTKAEADKKGRQWVREMSAKDRFGDYSYTVVNNKQNPPSADFLRRAKEYRKKHGISDAEHLETGAWGFAKQYDLPIGYARKVWKQAKGNWAVAFDLISKGNPASASAEVFEDFHGFAPSEVITVTKKQHYHEHLAAAGKLSHLKVDGIDKRPHTIKGFKGAILAFNEDCNQLFVEGGDQSLDLADFGIDSPHELETLGRLTDIGYQTNKTHLGDEGGEAVYVHKFRSTNVGGRHVVVKIARYPDLIYDVRNEQLLLSGGSYEILAEGINK